MSKEKLIPTTEKVFLNPAMFGPINIGENKHNYHSADTITYLNTIDKIVEARRQAKKHPAAIAKRELPEVVVKNLKHEDENPFTDESVLDRIKRNIEKDRRKLKLKKKEFNALYVPVEPENPATVLESMNSLQTQFDIIQAHKKAKEVPPREYDPTWIATLSEKFDWNTLTFESTSHFEVEKEEGDVPEPTNNAQSADNVIFLPFKAPEKRIELRDAA